MMRPMLFIVAAVLAVAIVALLVLRRPAAPSPAASTEVARPTTGSSETPPAPIPAPATPRGVRTAPNRAAEPVRAEPLAAAPVPAPALDVATLRIESDVPGAQVFIDRQFVGAAPVTADNVKPGSHQLNVSAEGFDGIAQTIDVTPGAREITIRFREVKLDARIPVIHKHRMGSCKGELIASPQGLRYETGDKDDAFSIPLGDLETFQVEYLDKTLKLKARRGKQFNFADPEGNADHLFVFHRDVDKARARLAKGDTPAGQ